MLTISLGMFQTLALAVLVIYFGQFLQKKFPILVKFCIPAPVAGATLISLCTLALYLTNTVQFKFDTSINSFFYNIFFATGGASASILLLKKGGKIMVIFGLAAAALAFLQNLLALGVGSLMGLPPLLSLMAGSSPLTGGHGSAGSFGPLVVEKAAELGLVGMENATGFALTAATFGLVAGCILGGPLGGRLVEKHGLKATSTDSHEEGETSKIVSFVSSERSFQASCSMILACGFGELTFGWVNDFLKAILPENISIVIPLHVMCLIGGIIVRLFMDLTGRTDEPLYESMSIVGEISLALFISTSIMTMELWMLIDLALPFLTILVLQLIMMYIFCTQITFRLCGKNYDSAVISAGHCGFSLGATAVAMASMESMKSKYGNSQLAFFVVPLVGGFLVDLCNALIVAGFINYAAIIS
ncbi:MAG: sodium/glutamate symporter [Eubacteriales bacterium]